MKTTKQIESKKNASKNASEKPAKKKPIKLAKDNELLMVCGGGIVVECQF